MRIHTPKLKAPSPLTVLAICLLWPAAATVGALVSNANAESVEPAQANVSPSSQPLSHHDATADTHKSDAKKSAAART